MIDGSDPNEVLNVARGYGSANLDKDSLGDPRIVGRIDGKRYSVFFYGCTDNVDCDQLQFYAYEVTENPDFELVNEWNSTKRYGTASIDSDNDVAFRMSVNLRFGVSRENLDDTFDWWRLTLEEFGKFDFEKGGGAK